MRQFNWAEATVDAAVFGLVGVPLAATLPVMLLVVLGSIAEILFAGGADARQMGMAMGFGAFLFPLFLLGAMIVLLPVSLTYSLLGTTAALTLQYSGAPRGTVRAVLVLLALPLAFGFLWWFSGAALGWMDVYNGLAASLLAGLGLEWLLSRRHPEEQFL